MIKGNFPSGLVFPLRCQDCEISGYQDRAFSTVAFPFSVLLDDQASADFRHKDSLYSEVDVRACRNKYQHTCRRTPLMYILESAPKLQIAVITE